MKNKHQNALSRVRKYFPQVEQVRDALHGVIVKVIAADARSGRKKDPSNCALAKACVREKLCDGAIIGISNSWLIKGTKATRYKTSATVAREITSFDRHQDFHEGRDYLLSRVSPKNRLGYKHWHKSGPRKGVRKETATVHHHHTENIRVM